VATPLMEQYGRIKKAHQEEILFFRMGDFYEMFFEDAEISARVLGIALTARSKGDNAVPMAGFPHHSADTYINRLLKAGYRVAICEQVQDPKEATGIVEREVVRVITPGTLIEEDALLEQDEHNYLAAFLWNKDRAGIAWIDLSTGQFFVEDTTAESLADVLERIHPSECLVPMSVTEGALAERGFWSLGGMLTPTADWQWERANAYRELIEHFQTANLAGFDCEEVDLGICAAGAIVSYLQQTQKTALNHVIRLERVSRDGRVVLDRSTQRSLELTRTLRDGSRNGSLLWVLDQSCSAMGARQLGEWTLSPLSDVEAINERQAAVAELVEDTNRRNTLRAHLAVLSDVERITARLGAGRANARDLVSLRNSLNVYPVLREEISFSNSTLFKTLAEGLSGLDGLEERLGDALVEDPPQLITDGGLFREGYHRELDELRTLQKEGKGWIAEFQAREMERTGISSLKVGYNKVFGYYLEVTNVHKDKVPDSYVRKQTLKNCERYIVEELKEYESKVLSADERAKDLEYQLFTELRDEAAQFVEPLQTSGRAAAAIDAIAALAETAVRNNYVRPTVTDEVGIHVKEGRHPVLERVSDEPFIPNDLVLDDRDSRTLLITGPNMAGKSTYIRQAALIVLMAQMGGYVPAAEATIGVVDRIFTRVGASDELHRGASTFMVEMNETANILNHATDRSLVILDEIGRGTSTYDGLSIAWAVTEYLHKKLRAKTLFATHYHELTELERLYGGVKNLHVAVREWGEEIVFMHKIETGGTDKSYGIHVARLAGTPKPVVTRAREILANLEQQALDAADRPRIAGESTDAFQMSLFGAKPIEPTDEEKLSGPDPVYVALDEMDLNTMTPLEALNALARLKAELNAPEPDEG
jgi:DNA mismatch repair protein MutS